MPVRLGPMVPESPKVQIIRRQGHNCFCQRVEPSSYYYGVPRDNAFHLGNANTLRNRRGDRSTFSRK
jgi:hypothetical protein